MSIRSGRSSQSSKVTRAGPVTVRARMLMPRLRYGTCAVTRPPAGPLDQLNSSYRWIVKPVSLAFRSNCSMADQNRSVR